MMWQSETNQERTTHGSPINVQSGYKAEHGENFSISKSRKRKVKFNLGTRQKFQQGNLGAERMLKGIPPLWCACSWTHSGERASRRVTLPPGQLLATQSPHPESGLLWKVSYYFKYVQWCLRTKGKDSCGSFHRSCL